MNTSGRKCPPQGHNNQPPQQQLEGTKVVGVLEYHNLDSLIRLIGGANECKIRVDGEKLWALVDKGILVSIITQEYFK